MKKNKTPIIDTINSILGNSEDYHCSFCQKMPSCILNKDGEISHSSYCEAFKQRIAHDGKIGRINIDCLVIWDSKSKKYSGRGYIIKE